MFTNDPFPTPYELRTLDDEQLNVLMERAESIREAAVTAGYPDYVQMCDERISAIKYEMVCRSVEQTIVSAGGKMFKVERINKC